jgi:hypothetical protein
MRTDETRLRPVNRETLEGSHNPDRNARTMAVASDGASSDLSETQRQSAASDHKV